MRRLMITFLLIACSGGVLLAQQTPSANVPAGDLPPAPGALTAGTPDTDDVESCVEVEIGGAKALDCINRKLKRDAEKVAPVKNLPPVDATSQDIHLGIVNAPAVKQQYGPNFGNSAVPYRPSRTFTPPLSPP
ncbi:hypothetical protein [Hyphomicrobium album]|uniref:hypothetical protein n=1 Tax=Hyphomicrobium album TaxID=2665159 RepID=UPI001E5280BA|nr:hypothetical protein [Hyphomicrobium album]